MKHPPPPSLIDKSRVRYWQCDIVPKRFFARFHLSVFYYSHRVSYIFRLVAYDGRIMYFFAPRNFGTKKRDTNLTVSA